MRAWLNAATSLVAAVLAITSFAWRAHADPDGSESAPGVLTMSAMPRPPISMVVNLRTQRAYVYRDGVPIRTTPVSSGKRGYRTPTGTFTVLEKQKVHHSNKYDNAPMPFMQRLSWWGLALHGGHVPGYPASHGCVRLPLSFARWLYGEPTMGMTVVITDQSRPEGTVAASRSADATDADENEDDPDTSQ
jgi:lipoprotein-anchoring transpeptidase ErfK/SrfK